jgi:ATP-dependent DNA helicase RecG
MTATPIPRTLALTIYGDLDITLLDEMPEGRKPVETDIVTDSESDRERIFTHCRDQLEAGRQVYVICPLIEKNVDEHEELTPQKAQMLQAKAVDEEAARLQQEEFSEYDVGILHGKLSAKEKESVMQQFLDGDLQVLVATSVVEVGVNVPNATTIVIENAERFGLAQLHQLRGRVLRSTHQAYCFAVAGSQSKKALDRLHALKSARTGFELAEYDLKLRGAGELYGRKQWGVSDVGMEAMQNMKMVEAAREEAKQLIATDPELDRHPIIAGMAEETRERIHFE